MTRMTGPDCVVMCNLINTHTHTHTHTHYAMIALYVWSSHLAYNQPGKVASPARGELNGEKTRSTIGGGGGDVTNLSPF